MQKFRGFGSMVGCRGVRFTGRMASVAECMMASNGKERMAPEKCGEVDYNHKAVPSWGTRLF